MLTSTLEHILKPVGEDGVGFGSDYDFDGARIPAGIGNAARLQNLVHQEDLSGDLWPQACYCLHPYPENGKLIAEVAADNSRFGR